VLERRIDGEREIAGTGEFVVARPGVDVAGRFRLVLENFGESAPAFDPISS
jgi:hypothetical protein